MRRPWLIASLLILSVCSHVFVHTTGLVAYKGVLICLANYALAVVLYAAFKLGMAIAKRWLL